MTSQQQVEAALERLRRVCDQRLELRELGKITAELVRVLFPPELIPNATGGLFASATEGGRGETPLFRDVHPIVDEAKVRCNWIAVCQIVAQNQAVSPAARLAQAAEGGALHFNAELAAVLRHGPDSFGNWLISHGLDVALGLTVLRLSCLPLLAPLADSVEATTRQSGWRHGNCPLCGQWPLFGELRGLEQKRWLRCGWCAAQWQVDRLFCPFCQNRDHRQHRDLFIDGEEQGNRLSVCDVCEQSIPVVPTLARLTAPELLVVETETLHWRLRSVSRA